ncbi:NUDIX hydrolase [Enterococcus caccae]|uniref:Nudix hydrolase domain-containing protein n=1 Tax=Enterococcus caccae ATCC BAA-1240 TaxID=1158612 RepID=R3TRQ5_9ENTE|nr:NUDIX domain-containing protein [Enterococcus caccae]EOL44279.1 hypothetical protein UC7_02323 [Enterococcus caccae ATCC BAA-1240]EOT68605.1 hypothetical protein I580_00988 [Enterococcus caccae ATCC BAA-1240]OJG28178.1 hypothetical protein RU98_GL001426 [Enterococcus caccae]
MAENEVLKIFDHNYQQISTATRQVIHSQGFWHETFHCWFYTIKEHELIVYFQKRASQKKDFPNQLDITAAGHLLAEETVIDGFREVKEELGIDVSIDQAQFLGVFPVEIALENFIDNEFTNVYLVDQELLLGDFYLQEEEVSCIFSVPLSTLKELFENPSAEAILKGVTQKNGQQEIIEEYFSKKDFCANAQSYYDRLIESFEKILEIQ